jgi:hypothetical protein
MKKKANEPNTRIRIKLGNSSNNTNSDNNNNNNGEKPKGGCCK